MPKVQSELFVRSYPTLAKLMASGDVAQEGVSYIDGKLVTIGSIVDPAGTERYLIANPSPDKW